MSGEHRRSSKRRLEEGEIDEREEEPMDVDPGKRSASGVGRGRGRLLMSAPVMPAVKVFTGSSTASRDVGLAEAEQKAGIGLATLMSPFNFMNANIPKVSIKVPSASAYVKKEYDVKDWTPPDDNVAKMSKLEIEQKYAKEAKEKERERLRTMLKDKAKTPSESGSLNQSLQTFNLEGVSTVVPVQYGHAGVTDDEEKFGELVSKYFSGHSRSRTDLPISQFQKRIIEAIKSNRVVIIEGPTGCGKTTQVAQFIADDCAENGHSFNIVVTQPRRIAATSIATRVAKERNWQLGSLVGYQIALDRTKVTEDTRILYCTTGVLIQKLIRDKKLENYSHIIIDEIHERSEETDILLMIIKKFMMSGYDVKLILMSASFDPEKVREYFTIPIIKPIQNDNLEPDTEDVPPSLIQMKKEGQMHQTSEFYLENMASVLKDEPKFNWLPITLPSIDLASPGITYEMYEIAARLIVKLDDTENNQVTIHRHSVLVFLPGYEEIQEMSSRLYSHNVNDKQWEIYPLHSSITHEEQVKVFDPPKPRYRKIILATNIAESSITVPDIVYVIDFCLCKNMVIDMETHFPMLTLEWASQSNCIQRAGRAGRVRDGRVYRLIPRSMYYQLKKYSSPELTRAPLELSVLRVKQLSFFGPPKELLGLTMDPPNLSDIHRAVIHLKQVGALTIRMRNDPEPNLTCGDITDLIDDLHDQESEDGWCYKDEDGELTVVGQIMASLPIDVRLSRLIIMGHAFDILDDAVTIAACLSNKGMFKRPFNLEMEAYKSRFAWSDRTFSDLIAYLKAFKMFYAFKSSGNMDIEGAPRQWCNQNYLQLKRLVEVDVLREDIFKRLRNLSIMRPQRPNQVRNEVEEELIIKVAICGAFYPNYFTRIDLDSQDVTKKLSSRDPYSTVWMGGLPQNEGILYAKHLREIFKPCADQVDLDFEDTKVFATFVDDSNPLAQIQARQTWHEYLRGSATPKKSKYRNTVIKTSVYLSIAMRNWRLVKDIHRFHKDVAKAKMEKINEKKSQKLSERRMLNTNRVHVPMIYTLKKIQHQIFPGLECREIDIFVTYMIDAGHYWASYRTLETQDLMFKLSGVISYSHDSIRCKPETIKLGDLVIATWNENNAIQDYCRAQITKIEYFEEHKKLVKSVTVFFIDYGNYQTFADVGELLEINPNVDPELFQIPAQAFECQLAYVKPSAVRCINNSWDEEATKYVRSVIKDNQKMKAKVYSIVNKVVRIELFDQKVNPETGLIEDISINEELLKRGFAEKAEESQQSLLDHNARKRAQSNTNLPDPIQTFIFCQRGPEEDEKGKEKNYLDKEASDKLYFQDEVVEVSIDESVPQVDRSRNVFTHEKICLTGPSSPLEASFVGVTRQTYSQKCHVERDSVNAVVLEPDYMSRHTRMLVAAAVHVSQSSNTIICRDTTLMPNIRGFPALMTLLFTPRAKIRVNREGNQYTGAICGIGCYKRSKKSYDESNDIELTFDSEMTREDLIKINMIRYHISDLYSSSDSLLDFAQGSLFEKQQKIRKLTIELLQRFRRFQRWEESITFKWHDRLPPFGESKPENQDQNELYFLPLLSVPVSNNYSYFEDVDENLKEMKEIIQTKVMNIVSITCKLCGSKLFTVLDIEMHEISELHIDELANFYREYAADKLRKEEKIAMSAKRLNQELN